MMDSEDTELHLFAADSPRRPGHEPFYGENDWTIDLPLHDGRTLFLHVGQTGHDALAAVFAEEASDKESPKQPKRKRGKGDTQHSS